MENCNWLFFMLSTGDTIKIGVFFFIGGFVGSSLKMSILAVHTACSGIKIREHGTEGKVT